MGGARPQGRRKKTEGSLNARSRRRIPRAPAVAASPEKKILPVIEIEGTVHEL